MAEHFEAKKDIIKNGNLYAEEGEVLTVIKPSWWKEILLKGGFIEPVPPPKPGKPKRSRRRKASTASASDSAASSPTSETTAAEQDEDEPEPAATPDDASLSDEKENDDAEIHE